MEVLDFSFIIPVFNRPDEIKELLESFLKVKGIESTEIVIVEDGSNIKSETIIASYANRLNITYYYKNNSGPGDSRNYGMQRARGNYFIILDSDCILPEDFLLAVKDSLKALYVDCFGGPDRSHDSFTNLQKAIDFSMTSLITTGGIRGNKKSVDKFQPRSFNMGLSKKAYNDSGGFGKIHPGEDPDLTIRLWDLGYDTKFIENAYVYHKRRISFKKFYQQVHKFGLVRPILNKRYPQTSKITYWFPSIFIFGFLASVIIGHVFNSFNFLAFYAIYFILAFILSLVQKKSVLVSIMVIPSIVIQFFGYGYGFLKSYFWIHLLDKNPREKFPKLFFKD